MRGFIAPLLIGLCIGYAIMFSLDYRQLQEAARVNSNAATCRLRDPAAVPVTTLDGRTVCVRSL